MPAFHRSAPPGIARERGLASVELALVLPVFLMVVLGTAELGRALYQFNTLTKSVRDGAQYIARNCLVAGQVDLTDSGVSAAVTTAKNLIVYGKPTATGTALLSGMTTTDCATATQNCVSVTAVAPLGGPTTYITVTAKYKFVPLFGAIPAFPLGSTIAEPGVVTSSITMAGIGEP